MKKIFALLLVVLSIFAFISCDLGFGKKDSEQEQTGDQGGSGTRGSMIHQVEIHQVEAHQADLRTPGMSIHLQPHGPTIGHTTGMRQPVDTLMQNMPRIFILTPTVSAQSADSRSPNSEAPALPAESSSTMPEAIPTAGVSLRPPLQILEL